MKKLLSFIFALASSASVYAALGDGPGGSFVQNQNTLQAHTTYYVSSGTVTNLQTTNLKFSDGSIQTTAATGGGGGSSSLQVKVNGVQISSPTSSLQFDSNFLGSNPSTGVSAITLNPNTTFYITNSDSLKSGTTFYTSSGTVGGQFTVSTARYKLILTPSTTQAFEIINKSSETAYIQFYGGNTARWRAGPDAKVLNLRTFDIYNEATGMNTISISTSDIITFNGTTVYPNLTPLEPLKLNSSNQVISGLIDLTSDVTGTLSSVNLPSNVKYTNVSQTISAWNNFTATQTFTLIGVSTIVWANGTVQVSSPAAGGSGSPGGSNTQVQFNDSSSFGGDSGFTYNKTNQLVGITSATISGFSGTALVSTFTATGIDAKIQRTASARYYTIEASTSDYSSASYSKIQLGNTGFTPTGSSRLILTAFNGPDSSSSQLSLFQGEMSFSDQNGEGVNYSAGTLNLNATSVSPSFNLQASGGTLGFQTPTSLASSVTWQLPNGDASGCWKSDGAGNLSIGSCGSGSIPSGSGPGQIIYTDVSDNYQLLNIGSSGQVLTVDGSGMAPAWINPSVISSSFSVINISTATGSTSWISTGLKAQITPRSASTRIKITVSATGAASGAVGAKCQSNLSNSGIIALGTNSLASTTDMVIGVSGVGNLGFTWIDLPNTTSPVTYTVLMQAAGATPTCTLCTDGSNTTCSILVEDIQAP